MSHGHDLVSTPHPFGRRLLRLGADWAELCKSRIGTFVVFAAFTGGLLAEGNLDSLGRTALAAVLIGMVAGASGVFNQVLERDLDRRMERTRGRPLPAGRVSVRDAILGGTLLAVVGTVGLAQSFNLLTALLALSTLLAYVLVYTPLKRVSSLNTVVGAIPGAMPPLLGYVATTSKDTSRTLLRIGPEEDPLLASWQVGLGRATSWTSDASPRWSQFWTGWDGYVDFWSSVVRDTFPVQTSGAVRTSVDGDTLRIRAEAEPGHGRVDAIVSTPDGDQTDVRLREVAPGIFEGEVSADGAGTYAVGVSGTTETGSQTLGSAIASVSYASEYRPGPADETLLQRISEVSGGRGAIDAAQAFDADELVSGRRSIDLANWFLLAAALAWLAAVVFSRLWLRRSQVTLAEAAAPSVRSDAPRTRRGFGRRAGAEPDADAEPPPAERPLRSWERVPKTERPRRMPPPPKPSAPAASPAPPPPPSAPPPPPPSAATVNELLKARRERNDE